MAPPSALAGDSQPAHPCATHAWGRLATPGSHRVSLLLVFSPSKARVSSPLPPLPFSLPLPSFPFCLSFLHSISVRFLPVCLSRPSFSCHSFPLLSQSLSFSTFSSFPMHSSLFPQISLSWAPLSASRPPPSPHLSLFCFLSISPALPLCLVSFILSSIWSPLPPQLRPYPVVVRADSHTPT